MQKPFKGTEFDGMLKAILDLDPHARLLLHDLESAPLDHSIVHASQGGA